MSNYVNLHCHDSYSIRDSCLKIDALVKRTVDYKLPAVCVSNHGNGHSWSKLAKEAKRYDLKSIYAIEFYYADDATDKGDNYHLMAYAKDKEGYKNLCKLTSWSYLNGFYRKPRIDKSILEEYKEGLIVSTACCFSKAGQLIANNLIDDAVEEIEALHSIFKDDFYLEIMDHGFEEEDKIRDFYRNYGKEHNIKVIATNDTHYEKKEDQEFHGIFKNISYASGGEKDSAFSGTGFHILSPDEMAAKFEKSELDNTIEIADKCNVQFKFEGYYLPKYVLLDDTKDTYEFLRDICFTELKVKGLDTKKEYVDRLEYELNMLHMADLENYLLIVSDYCKWAKNNDVPVGPGRGSMGGSIVSWLTDITEVDPLQYDLLFARAVNPGRCLALDFGV
jgi:DNA polymerase III subunit alpha